MGAVVTISERNARALRRRQEAIARAIEELRAFAVERGGRFLIFGSAATGHVRRDSDLDILVDFPPEIEAEARERAEEICCAHEIPSDVDLLRWSSARFLKRIGPHAVVLG